VTTNGDILNIDLCDLQKARQIKNLGIMSCILIRYTYDKNLEMIQSLVQELWPPGGQTKNQMDRNLVCELLLPSGTYVQSFGSTAPVATKRALQTDDDDGHHVIV
jgi:hypothetical protein